MTWPIILTGIWLTTVLVLFGLIIATEPRRYVTLLIRDALLYAAFTAVAAIPLLTVRHP